MCIRDSDQAKEIYRWLNEQLVFSYRGNTSAVTDRFLGDNKDAVLRVLKAADSDIVEFSYKDGELTTFHRRNPLLPFDFNTDVYKRQLYEAEGNKAAAYKAFAKAGGASNASYRTKFNARIKQSEVFEGEDIAPEVKALRNMTRYDRNKEYLDQIYYAIGNLYLSRRDTTAAVENYKKAVEQSTRNGIEKAIVQVALGGLYYDLHKYNLAQPCYSEAVPMLPDDYPDLKLLKHRSDCLLYTSRCV